MLEANFYAVYTHSVNKVLATLLEKAQKLQASCGILLDDQYQAIELDKVLWTSLVWLPHCLTDDELAEDTPIVIGYGKKINKITEFLFILDQAETIDYNYKKLFVIFDAKNPEILEYNRTRWKDYLAKGINVKFYQQDNFGKFNEVTTTNG